MRYATFLFCSTCLFIVSGASAQDGGMDSGRTDVDAGAVESLDPTMSCLQRCSQTHEMCVSAATFMDCIATEPACTDVRPRDAEILAAFCAACGQATVGCEPHEPAVAPVGTGTVLAPSASSSAPLTSGTASGTDPPTPHTRTPTAAERERSQLERARGICTRQRGIWEAETSVLMPDGSLRLGVCRTPEGAELVQMIHDEHDARAEADDHLGTRITTEERARIAADTIHDRDIAVIEDGDRARDGRIATLLAEVACAQAHVDRFAVSRLDAETRRVLYDTNMVHDGYFVCGSVVGHIADDEAVAASGASSTHRRRPHEHPTLGGEGSGLHIRLQLFGHVGFTSIHPTLAQMRGGLQTLPAGLGFDATVFAPIANGWYVEGGAGLTYDWPDFQPFATNARVWYHAGLAAYVLPIFSIGFGYIGSDRFRPNLTSAYSTHGGYLDLSLHFHMRLEGRDLHGSSDVTDPAFVITLRGSVVAAIRPAAALAPDGDIQLMAGLEF